MLNKWIGIGRLTRDPESLFFSSGDQQTTASLVTSRTWRDKNTGEKKEKAQFHNLVFSRGLAKVAADYLTKGSLINVEGEIDYQEWEKDGVKKYMTRILVSDMKMLGGNQQGEQSQQRPAQPKQAAPQNNQQQNNGGADFDQDDIPF